jgi:hypothetical protein
MAAPNLINANTINGKTSTANLTSNSATSLLSNAASSGKCLKVNVLNISNYGGSTVSFSVNYYNAAGIGGSPFPIIGSATVPSGTTINIIDKSSQYYLEENTSIGVIAATANSICATCSYEEIS